METEGMTKHQTARLQLPMFFTVPSIKGGTAVASVTMVAYSFKLEQELHVIFV